MDKNKGFLMSYWEYDGIILMQDNCIILYLGVDVLKSVRKAIISVASFGTRFW